MKVIITCRYKYRHGRRRGKRIEREEYNDNVSDEEKKTNKRLRRLLDEDGRISIDKLHDYMREKIGTGRYRECKVFFHRS